LLCAVRRAAGQHGRNKPFYQDYSFRKEYMSVGNLVHKHAYLDAEA
jgi:predicted patatin/cPLA2 family phospholipase